MVTRLDLLVVADHVGGGLGASAVAHSEWFAARGWAVGLAAPHQAAGEQAGVRRLPLPIAGSALDLAAVRGAARELRRLVKETRPAVVHVHGTRSQLLCLFAGRLPYVTMHGAGGRVPGQRPAGTAMRALGRAVAPRLARGAYSASPSGRGWRTVLHASPRLAEMEQVGPVADGSTPVFLWLGRLDQPKEPMTFVRACALAAERVDLRGVVVGDGPQGAQLAAEADRLGAPVSFVGATDDVATQMEAAWALCLFSGFEGVPFSVQEAMWAGRPVVLSPLPSLRWFAGSAASYAGDAAAAADLLVALAAPEETRARGEDARKRVRGLLSPDDPFPRYLRDYGPAMTSR
jgi:glycosyltransferase involved in cell wall biosynthesis